MPALRKIREHEERLRELTDQSLQFLKTWGRDLGSASTRIASGRKIPGIGSVTRIGSMCRHGIRESLEDEGPLGFEATTPSRCSSTSSNGPRRETEALAASSLSTIKLDV